MKKLLALGLVLALTLSAAPAMAAGTADKFPQVATYAGFADVAEKHWASESIQICCETELMKGKGAGFDPLGIVTVAEAAAIAARLGSALTGTPIPTTEDKTWFAGSCQYVHALATRAGDEYLTALLTDPTGDADRGDFFSMLILAIPATALAAKNSITALPDVESPDLLRFYNAGVLTGVNAYGTFAPYKPLTRAEMAVMVAHIARPETRITFTLKAKDDPSYDPIPYYTGFAGDTPVLTGKDISISMSDYLAGFVAQGNLLAQACAEQGVEFSWSNTMGDRDFVSYARLNAVNAMIQTSWDAVHKNDVYDTSAVLGAKHILISNEQLGNDGALAEARRIRALLTAAGDSEAEFDKLMNEFSQDGRTPDGTLGAPEGYTFTDGDMVAEFEAGTKALSIGQISAPVRSEFGYHIILRTPPDPAEARQKAVDAAYGAWWDTQGFTYTEALSGLNEAGFYDSYTHNL